MRLSGPQCGVHAHMWAYPRAALLAAFTAACCRIPGHRNAAFNPTCWIIPGCPLAAFTYSYESVSTPAQRYRRNAAFIGTCADTHGCPSVAFFRGKATHSRPTPKSTTEEPNQSGSEFEKANLVSKLKAARDRKRRETGRCEGRKPLAETNPDTVAEARRLYRSRNGKRRSLRQIATMLAAEGHLNSKARPYDAKQVARMVA